LAAVLLVLFAAMVVLFVVLPVAGMALWAILTTIVVGLIIGGLARLVVPGRQPIGLVATVLAGLCGSIVGGFLGQRVMAVGGLATVLLEIAVAAALVALIAGGRRRQLQR
jgi:uncharacterized membrane protein YeaQ/YmgE (transglycosylase-associated protein family)